MNESRRQELIAKYGSKRTTLSIPAIHTNATLIAGLPDDFDNNLLQRKRAEDKAHAAGVSTTGKRFVGSLCPDGEPNSPEAWVNESDYLGECATLARKQGKGLSRAGSGRTIVEAPANDAPDPNDEPYRPNDAVVGRAVKEEVAERVARGEPAPTKKQRVELGEKLRELHAGAYA